VKFVTEEDLRDLYKIKPFTDYVLEPSARMTPGARQFLTDRGISTNDDDSASAGKNEIREPTAVLAEKKNDYKSKKLNSIMKSVEAKFFLTEQELLSRDVLLAQSVICLGKQFSCLKNAVKSKVTVEDLRCKECTGIKNDNFSDDLEDCFEITEFHIQLEKGREIAILHQLRCALDEMISDIQELFKDESGQCEELVGKVNQIANSLSQLICSTYGGKKCLRQN